MNTAMKRKPNELFLWLVSLVASRLLNSSKQTCLSVGVTDILGRRFYALLPVAIEMLEMKKGLPCWRIFHSMTALS